MAMMAIFGSMAINHNRIWPLWVSMEQVWKMQKSGKGIQKMRASSEKL
jgi:hypothetical protein